MRIAVVPGSFDPMTLGHRNLIERSLTIFDLVIVAIFANKDKVCTFSFEQRAEIARITLKDLERVKVVVGKGYLADFAKEVGACAIVKGIRNSVDLQYENSMAFFNLERNPNAQTVYLPSIPDFKRVSSTMARKRLEYGGSLEGLMQQDAAEYAKKVIIKNET